MTARNYESSTPTFDSLGKYLDAIGKVELLEAEEEVELSKTIEVGLYAAHLLEREEFSSAEEFEDLQQLRRQGEVAKKHMIEANLRMVVSIAKRYRGRGVPFSDLLGEGNLAVVKSLEKFDYQKGYKFSTLAYGEAQRAIIQSFYTQGSMKLSMVRKMSEQVAKLSKYQRVFEAEHFRQPNRDEMMTYMGMTEDQLRDILLTSKDYVSFDMPFGEDEEIPMGEAIKDINGERPDETLIAQELYGHIHAALGSLSAQETIVVEGRFGFNSDDDMKPPRAFASDLNKQGMKVERDGKLLRWNANHVSSVEGEAVSKLGEALLQTGLFDEYAS